MTGFRATQASLFGILMLLSTALTEQEVSFTVRVGDEVTLPCGNVMEDQLSCDRTSWNRSPYENSIAVELISSGKISNNEEAKSKSKRLRVTAKCSLVITNVSREDVGRYFCRRYTAERNHLDAYIFLSVTNIESHDGVLFYCNVFTYVGCQHSVQWIYEGNMDDIVIDSAFCAKGVFLNPGQNTMKDFKESLTCNVTDQRSGRSLQMKVSPQSSAEEKEGSTPREDPPGDTTQGPKGWWPYAAAAAAAVATLFVAVAMVMLFMRRKKTKGMKTQRVGDSGQSLKPAESRCDAETGQEKVDPGDEVSYATVNYTRNIGSKTQAAAVDGDGDGDTVTYSTVKTPSPADGASVDPSSLYAVVQRAGKGEAPG